MKKTIEFECKIITPMFAGTALPGECELRPPAIKGALRFWWRALHGHLPIKDLREKEREIFGGVGKAVRRSSFDVAVEHEMVAKMPPQDDLKKKGKLGKWEEVKGKSFSINVLDYLAYGKHIRKFRGEYKPDGKEKKEIKYIQKCFLPDQRFLLKISYSTDNESSMESVWQALDCLVRFGGLGSQTRNGWGQFEILNWPDALKK
ncbi:MAG TPA: type III-B CRISPR module RAMP protein Cmr1, partial [Bacteroidetes bacterium]|nr:type III-B CRISPR module RAMP protein Cmr1 [Bacteroidota bacterium]